MQRQSLAPLDPSSSISQRPRSPLGPLSANRNARPGVPRQPSVPSIRIRRQPSRQSLRQDEELGVSDNNSNGHGQIAQPTRFRSISDPQRPWSPSPEPGPSRVSHLPVVEELTSPVDDQAQIPEIRIPTEEPEASHRRQLAKPRSTPSLSRFPTHQSYASRAPPVPPKEYESELVDFLDAIGNFIQF